MAEFDIDRFVYKGIIGILICLALFVASEYVSTMLGLPILGFIKWFFMMLAAAILLIIILARMSQK